jgi:DNA-binding transcriptional ArsR family regulator
MVNRMVERPASPASGTAVDPAILDGVFHALADRTRRAMLQSLAAGARTVGELAAPYDMSLAAASKHVRVLERAGLVHRSVQGRHHLCRLDAARLADAEQWLVFYQRFWPDRLASVDRLLASRPIVQTRRRNPYDR